MVFVSCLKSKFGIIVASFFVFLCIFYLTTVKVYAYDASVTLNTQSSNQGGDFISIYSPDVTYYPDLNKYLMVYGANKVVRNSSNPICDQIYITENYSDGANPNNWVNTRLLLPTGEYEKYFSVDHTDTYESKDYLCIHDPSLVFVNGNWYLYYTGYGNKNDRTDSRNYVFLATSPDLIHWTKKGIVKGLSMENYSAGTFTGHPDILYNEKDHNFYLYFFTTKYWEIIVAESYDGFNFTNKKGITGSGFNPNIAQHFNTYVLTFDLPVYEENNRQYPLNNYEGIYYITSDNPTTFDINKKELVIKRSNDNNTWYGWHIGTSSYEPITNKFYFFGNNFTTTHDLEFGKIGVINNISIPPFYIEEDINKDTKINIFDVLYGIDNNLDISFQSKIIKMIFK